MLVVEPARPSEVQDIVRLAREGLGAVNAERLAVALDHEECLVARWGSRVLGFAVASREEPCEGHIVAMAVDRLHRGEGVGSALLRGVGDAMARSGAYRLSLEVRADNAPARNFYGNHGFVPEGLRPHAYPDGEDAVTYSRPIR